jgi:hypothetical protein
MADRNVAESSRPSVPDANLRWTWHHLEDALRELQFGAITLTVQDGVVVQVERVERKRYQRSIPNTNRDS